MNFPMPPDGLVNIIIYNTVALMLVIFLCDLYIKVRRARKWREREAKRERQRAKKAEAEKRFQKWLKSD